VHGDGDFDGAGFVEQAVGGVAVAAGGGDENAVGTVDELVVGGRDVDHQVAVDGAGANHDAGGEHVEDKLGGGAGLHAGGAGDGFGTGDGSDGEIGDFGDGRAGDAGESDGERSDGAGVEERAEDIGGASAGGDADEGVGGGGGAIGGVGDAEAGGDEVARAVFGGVFGVFGGVAQGGVATGDEGLEERGWDREGGWTLGCVEYAETAAGAGADVEEAAAFGEALGDDVDRAGDGRDFSSDCGGDSGVLLVDEGEHVERGDFVDVFGAWVAGFGA